MNLFKRILLIVLCVSFLSLLGAQDDFETWKSQQKAELEKYISEQDKAFASFLEKNWEPFEASKADVKDTTPKPVAIPKVEPQNIEELEVAEKIEEIKVPPTMQIEEKEQDDCLVTVKMTEDPRININYLGLPLELNYQQDLGIQVQSPINEKGIADFWYSISNIDHTTLFTQTSDYREQLKLNDWGYCLLLNEITKEVSGESQNLARLLLWFMLTKSGYEAKVGFAEDNVYLLLPCKNKIYGVSYVVIDDKRFYTLSFDKKEQLNIAINTYDGKYPNADDLIDLSIKDTPKVKSTLIEKELKFSYENTEYSIPVTYNQTTAEYFKNYPQTDLEVYFKAPLSDEATYSLTIGLKPILEGRTEADAANVLLRFVQTAFQYKTDGEQFGGEKSLFSDETLFYPYSDCEDRSIIFSYLISNILGLNVIGLDYPGHVSTAVHFQNDLLGDKVRYNATNFVVCDPTYINANIGMAMPKFKEVKPKIIDLQK
ncbi:MAG: hypothetical protein HOK80_07585 [Candidatus Cloacimonetes bacterium]|jgi:hypothetical protein|nr:hypothetical protein [Candidatus Cloacimonadota bacterium]MBT4333631.1 hypothetical protein [Candidatus Cloacimonadota bacterium]MBT4575509.1 hypothetical protein [Candidatus Cloacimonadota bacterium]MBT5420738.1 hypothetical protein [Candidatus Cloacimonadota bacterium]